MTEMHKLSRKRVHQLMKTWDVGWLAMESESESSDNPCLENCSGVRTHTGDGATPYLNFGYFDTAG